MKRQKENAQTNRRKKLTMRFTCPIKQISESEMANLLALIEKTQLFAKDDLDTCARIKQSRSIETTERILF